MNWIDVAIIVILLIFIGVGFWKGFIFSILSMFGTFINFVISIILTKPTSLLLNNWFHLETAIENKLTKSIAGMNEGFNTNLIGMSKSEISKHVSTTLENSDFPLNNLFDKLININPDKVSHKSELTLNHILSDSLSKFFTLIISFAIIFALIYLILFIITIVTKKIKEIESIRITDRILGVLFGAIKGAITIIFIIGFIALFKEDGIFDSVVLYIKDSTIGGFAYSHINTFVDKYITLENVVKTIKK